jgi:hypothetical protein
MHLVVQISATGRVACTAVTSLPLSITAAWGQLRHLPTSATHDPFHARVHVGRSGALVIEHRYLVFRTVRVGRVLWWREGIGFAFSDLSRTDAAAAFPHVLSYRLEPVGPQACRLHVRVGGRWTLPGPRWIGRLWLRWVFGHVVRTVRNEMLRYAVVRQQQSRRCHRREDRG